MHIGILILVAFAAIVLGFAVGLCITAKHADGAMTKAINERIQKEKL